MVTAMLALACFTAFAVIVEYRFGPTSSTTTSGHSSPATCARKASARSTRSGAG